MTPDLWSAYSIPLTLALLFHVYRKRRRELQSRRVLKQAVITGMTEPPSLHPVIDPTLCCGSQACVRACPEQALGIVNGKAQLINPTVCIGHGACAAACPVEAIQLVFGTARRGMDIPYVKPSFETNVPGIYIAGELGGMGLVGKAAEQGKQAIASLARDRGGDAELDVVIVGAGPAGLSATLGAMERKLRFVTLEQDDSLGGTVYHYPRNKIVMTHPMVLPIVGKARLGEVSKEALLRFWQDIIDRVGMEVRFGHRVDRIEPAGKGYLVRTNRGDFRTRNIVLSIGRRGTPRRLDVPGEDLPKVVYRLIDAEQYQHHKVLVVGGGDSAVEAALALCQEPGTAVSLSYRAEAFTRLKPANRDRLQRSESEGRLRVLLSSTVIRIEPDQVRLQQGGTTIDLANDAVIICAGGVLPTGMLRDVGIRVETKFGTT